MHAMKLLILGGTRFLGRHLAQQALQAGHQLTLLHRGRSQSGLFPQARHVLADRDTDLASALAGHERWDAVVDTSAYFPRQVQQAAEALAGRVGQYQLVSTISVYSGLGAQGTDEDGALEELDPAMPQDTVGGGNYGGLKVQCETAARAAFGDRCLISRPGLLVGPHDPTGRFTWWAQRFERAGAAGEGAADNTVIAPGDPAGPVQFIDARDAAAWMLLQAEAGRSGIVNLTGPAEAATLGDFLRAAQHALAPRCRLQWLPEAFLLEQGVAPWADVPMWLAADQAGLLRVDIRRALATGLQCRPWAETLRDTAAWAAESGASGLQATGAGMPARPAVGLTPEREAALLQAWAPN
jgi:2'-hydroxyisoflavone reductase